MIVPDYSREERLFQKGYLNIAGIDEAGRGPLAGPVVAAAVVFSKTSKVNNLIEIGLRDSKILSSRKREYLYEKIIEYCKDWSVSVISEEIIDNENILEATKLAMRRAVESLKTTPDFLLIDGISVIDNFSISQLAIPNGDKYVFSISAASVMAKVTRDKILIELDSEFPDYGFAKHKGYGTKEHFDVLLQKGPCKIHRKSFRPVVDIMSKLGTVKLAK